MVRCSLLSLGMSLLLAASPIAAQNTTSSTSTTSRSTTSSGTSSTTSGSTTLTTSTKATGTAPTAAPTACVNGLQIFVARGSNEPAGLGRIGVVAGNVTQKIKDSAVTAVDYPATFVDYNQSVGNGTSKLKSLVEDYVKKCPDNKIALMGYSQGAQAVGDLICGTSSEGFPSTPDLDSRYEKNIVAIVLYGDPTRAVSQPWNAGTATNQSSFFPRKNNAGCAPYSVRMRSWCDIGDRYCATGNQSEVHGSYFNKYEGETTKWVVEQFNKALAGGNTTTSATGSATSNRPSGTSAGATTTPSSPPNSGASGLSQAGGSSACLALALGLAYLLSM